jgi:hypothetical protein
MIVSEGHAPQNVGGAYELARAALGGAETIG